MRQFDSKAFGRAIRATRNARGLSQGEVGRIVGITQSAVSRHELGWRPAIDHALALAEWMNRPITDWLGPHRSSVLRSRSVVVAPNGDKWVAVNPVPKRNGKAVAEMMTAIMDGLLRDAKAVSSVAGQAARRVPAARAHARSRGPCRAK